VDVTAQPRRIWPALLLTGLLGGAAGAGGLLWLDRAGHLPLNATAGTDPGAEAVSAEIAALRGQLEELRRAQAEGLAGLAATGTQPDMIEPLRAQIAALEQTVGELSLRPAAGGDSEAMTSVEARLLELEGRAAQPEPQLGPIEERLAALESRPAAAGADLGPVMARLDALEQRVEQAAAPQPDAALESRLAELDARVAAAATPDALRVLEARLDETATLAQELRERPPVDLSGVQSELADLRTRLDELGDRLATAPTRDQVAALEAAVRGAATAEQLSALESQLAAAPREERVAALETALEETRIEAGKATNLGPAIAASALTTALQSGAPFRAELDALRGLGLDPAVLDPLAAHADAGLPTSAELRSGFDQAVAGVDLSQPIPPSAGAVNRLLQSARSLVEVRAAGPATGADPAAVAGRVRAALDREDLRAALAEWQVLPEQVKGSTADWARLARARAEAEELAARLRTEALSRIAAGG
jgi:hypothetical protein